MNGAMLQKAEGAELRELVSALMDGELDDAETRRCLERLCSDGDRRADWELWHAASDALRSSDVAALHAQRFSARLAERLADEPAIVAPQSRRSSLRFVRRIAMPGAAAVAAMAVLTIVAVPMLRDAEAPGGIEIARVGGASQPAAPMVPVVASVARAPVAPVLRQPTLGDADRFDIYLSAHGQMTGALGMPRTSQYLRQGPTASTGAR
jgi:sigma-E factor negative regulatory protein RseA